MTSVVLGKIFGSLEAGQYKLSTTIAEMSVEEKFEAIQYFQNAKYWPDELSHGAFVEGEINADFLERLILIRPSALGNPTGLLASYIDKSPAFVEYCYGWLKGMAVTTSNIEFRDDFNIFITELEGLPLSYGKVVGKMLSVAREARNGLHIVTTPRVAPSPRSRNDIIADAKNAWSVLNPKTQQLHFVEAALHRIERQASGASISSSSAPSPIAGQRSGTPSFPVETSIPPRSRKESSVRQLSAQNSPRTTITPRSGSVTSSRSAPSGQIILRGVEVEGKDYAIGMSSGIYGWIRDITLQAYIGKLSGEAFNGEIPNVKDFFDRIEPFSAEEVEKIERSTRGKYVPYVRDA